MQTLSVALRARGEEGAPLPQPLRPLSQAGVRLVRSQLSLVAGAPGMGKSSILYWMIARMRYPDGSGVPTLYFSADADRMTVAKSVLSGLSDQNQMEIEALIKDDADEVSWMLDEHLGHVWWCFETMPSLQDIDQEVDAYAYVNGEYPHLVVVDNLMDVAESGEDLHLVSDVQVSLKSLARRTSAHVMALSHVKGPFTDGMTPVGRGGLMYNIDKKPELILTIHQVEPGVMGIRVVKNRNGPAATSGLYGPNVGWQPDRGWLGG